MDVGCCCRHSTYHLVIVMLGISVVGQKGEVVYIWYVGCDLVAVLGCLRWLGCCSWSYGGMDDVGIVACFHCCNCAVRSVDDVVCCCFCHADDGCCSKSFHVGFGCRIGYDENNVFVKEHDEGFLVFPCIVADSARYSWGLRYLGHC